MHLTAPQHMRTGAGQHAEACAAQLAALVPSQTGSISAATAAALSSTHAVAVRAGCPLGAGPAPAAHAASGTAATTLWLPQTAARTEEDGQVRDGALSAEKTAWLTPSWPYCMLGVRSGSVAAMQSVGMRASHHRGGVLAHCLSTACGRRI